MHSVFRERGGLCIQGERCTLYSGREVSVWCLGLVCTHVCRHTEMTRNGNVPAEGRTMCRLIVVCVQTWRELDTDITTIPSYGMVMGAACTTEIPPATTNRA